MWKQTKPSACLTHHQLAGDPCYPDRFDSVLPFHDPGLAPVQKNGEAFHIHVDGSPAYEARFLRTYGFYCGRAAVNNSEGAFHIDCSGEAVYPERYEWCGNFQSDVCPVRDDAGNYFHIALDGQQIYPEKYSYVGDFREGSAVVNLCGQQHTHINMKGELLHGNYFSDLDVFHKGYARAKADGAWFHVNVQGQPIYKARFKNIEPFYNDIALVENFDGSKVTIDHAGNIVTEISKPTKISQHVLSADMVGFWKGETLSAAAKLGILDQLPSDSETLSRKLAISKEKTVRFLRALWELAIVEPKAEKWSLTKKGQLFVPSVAAASIMWSDVHKIAWGRLVEIIKSPIEEHHPTFKELETKSEKLQIYLDALDGYAELDLGGLYDQLELQSAKSVVGCGRFSIPALRRLQKTYPDKSVIHCDYKKFLSEEVESIALEDYLRPWPIKADVILIPRVLHYWTDSEARILLQQAKNALNLDGRLYLVEFLLHEDHPNGSLLDLNMLVESGGKERTSSQILELLDYAGMKVVNSFPSGGWTTTFEVTCES